MLAIIKSIYDMMGPYTYPSVKADAPSEHVEKFFQVSFIHSFIFYPVVQKVFKNVYLIKSFIQMS